MMLRLTENFLSVFFSQSKICIITYIILIATQCMNCIQDRSKRKDLFFLSPKISTNRSWKNWRPTSTQSWLYLQQCIVMTLKSEWNSKIYLALVIYICSKILTYHCSGAEVDLEGRNLHWIFRKPFSSFSGGCCENKISSLPLELLVFYSVLD